MYLELFLLQNNFIQSDDFINEYIKGICDLEMWSERKSQIPAEVNINMSKANTSKSEYQHVESIYTQGDNMPRRPPGPSVFPSSDVIFMTVPQPWLIDSGKSTPGIILTVIPLFSTWQLAYQWLYKKKTTVTPTHWNYWSLALNHQYTTLWQDNEPLLAQWYIDGLWQDYGNSCTLTMELL